MLSLNLTHLIDDAKCYETIRQMRWASGVCCPKCNSPSVIKRGKMRPSPIANAINVKYAVLTLMTLPTQSLQAIISRYGCGYCVYT